MRTWIRRGFAATAALLGMMLPAAAFGQATIFSENFEGGAPGWTLTSTNPPVAWGADATPVPGSSAPNSLNYNNGTTYDSGTTNSGSAVSPTHSIVGTLNPRVQFNCRYQTESSSSFDQRFLEVLDSANAVLFTRQYLPAGSIAGGTNETCPASGSFHLHTVVLNPAWNSVKIRFRFNTVDSISNAFQGWAVDDYAVLHDFNPGPNPQIANPSPLAGAILGTATPTFQAVVQRSLTGSTVSAEFSIDGGPFVAGSVVTDYGTSTFVSPALAEGNHTYIARAQDSAGLFSPATSTIPFIVDTSTPVAGSVNDGFAADLDIQGARTVVTANWTAFSDAQSGIVRYDWAIGTTPGGTNIQGFTNVGLALRANTSPSLLLLAGQKYYVTVRATNGVGTQSTATSDGFSVMTLATATGLQAGQRDAAYTTSLTATFGTGPYTFGFLAGGLPPGLTLAPNGTISGTPTSTGRYLFAVTETDSLAASRDVDFTIEIFPSDGSLFQTTGNSSVPSDVEWGVLGFFLTRTFQAQGGSSPLVWRLTTGPLPAGLSLDSLSGVISGTPSGAPGTYAVTLTVDDSDSPTSSSSASFAFVVAGAVPALSITTGASLPVGRMNCPYVATLAAAGGLVPYSWAVTSGTLPTGLTLSSSGTISGTPAAVELASFTVTVTDAAGSAVDLSATLDVTATGGRVLTVSPGALPVGIANVPYPVTFGAAGGTEPYAWGVSSGALPPGLALNPLTGALTGTPSTRGLYRFVVTVMDAGSVASSASVAYEASILAAAVPAGFYAIVTPSPIPDAVPGVPYSTVLSTFGGTLPNSWVLLSGNLPPGLTLDDATGAISGTPTSAGSYGFSVSALSANGLSSAKSFVLQSGAPPGPVGGGGGGGCGLLGLEALALVLALAARRRAA